MEKFNTKIGIIGGGPAGYALAIKLAQNDVDVTLFEKEFIGGTCLNKGCIPTKSILHNSGLIAESKELEKFGAIANFDNFDVTKIFQTKDTVVSRLNKSLELLLKSYKINIVKENVIKFTNKTIITDNFEYTCERIVIATGTKPAHIDNLKTDNNFIYNSDGILQLEKLPKSIAVIGSGAIGIEWSRIFSNLGVEVTLIEALDRILPIADSDVSARLERLLKKKRVKIEKGVKVLSVIDKELLLSNDKKITPEIVLVAIGRTPNLPQTELDIQKERGYLVVDDNFMTNIKDVYAIGDINGLSMLAHSATHQAIELAQYFIHQEKSIFKSKSVPSVIYGEPEIAWFGKTEDTLINSNTEYKKVLFPISALGKAHADNEIDGFMKILIDKNNFIFGASIVAPEASSLIMQLLIAKENNLPYTSILKVIFPHPTYSEGIFEALLAITNNSLSLPKSKE